MSAVLKERKRLRLQVLARALAEKNALLVRFGSSFHTDLTAITVRDLDQDGFIVPGVPASAAECWVSMKTGCAHEAGHILFTNKNDWESAVARGPLFQNIVNILEDARVERAVANAYPGTLLWFRFSNEYIMQNRTDWGEGADAFLKGLCAYAVAGVVPDALSPKEKSLIEKCKPFADQARVSDSTFGAFLQAEEIFKLVEAAYPGVSVPPPPPMPGTATPQVAPGGTLDPRRTRPLGGPESKGKSGREDSLKELGADQEPDGAAGPAESDLGSEAAPEPDAPDEPEPDSEPAESDNAGSAEAEPGEPSSENIDQEPDSTSGHPESEPKPGEPEPGGEPSGVGPAGLESGEPSPESDSDSGELNPGDESTPESGESELDGESEHGAPGRTEPELGKPEPEPGADPFSGDNPGDPGVADEEDFGPDPEPAGENFFCGFPEEPGEGCGDPELKELLDDAAEELSKIESGAEREENLRARETALELDLDQVSEELARSIHAGVQLEIIDLPADPPGYQALVQSQAGLIRRLADEIRKALEYRRSVPRRALKKGRLDPGALWKTRLADPGVFCRADEPGSDPALAVYLLVDCSGSMIGEKMNAAKSAATALHEMCNTLGVTHCVTGFNSDGGRPVQHWPAVDWNKRDGARIASLEPNFSNRDGFSIRIAARELAARREPKKLLAVLSDGLPSDHRNSGALGIPNYWGDLAVADTARAVREAERAGIGVVGIYFGGESDLPQARMIYNHLVYAPYPEALPAILGREFKKVMAGL